MVEVDGRMLASNGCRRSSDCFNCKEKDCKASPIELIFLDRGKSIEEVQAWVTKTQKSHNEYMKKWRKRKKEQENG